MGRAKTVAREREQRKIGTTEKRRECKEITRDTTSDSKGRN